MPVSQPDASARARGQYPQRLACAAEMTSKDLERGDAGRSRRADEMAELASARIVTSHVTTINNKRAGRELPTEAAPLLGSSEDRPRSSGFGMARKIVGGVVLATCVGVAALSVSSLHIVRLKTIRLKRMVQRPFQATRSRPLDLA